MYPRVLRTALNFSPKLKGQHGFKNVTLTFSAFTLETQKLLTCSSYHCSIQNFCSEEKVRMPLDPKSRQNKIEEMAQRKIDALKAENPEIERQMKILELEISVLRQSGDRVPSTLRPRDWYELITLKSPLARKKFLDYLFVIERQKEKSKQDQIDRNLLREQFIQQRVINEQNRDQNEIIYGIGYNSMLRRITEPIMKHLWQWNNLRSIMYGNKIIFDCSYEKYMNSKEKKSCAKQILESFAVNRMHNYAFDVYMCNVNFSGELMDRLSRYIPTIFDDDFPWTVTSKSYLELFDKSKLLYLSGHAQNTLEKYDPDTIYIIGAFVDKSVQQPISLEKSKEQNLRMAKLPLDKYIRFGDGSGKNLTLNQVIAIMLDIQETKDWNKALVHVPRRKLYENRVAALEKKVQRDILDLKQSQRDNQFNNSLPTKFDFESSGVADFSHAARAKIRNQWNK